MTRYFKAIIFVMAVFFIPIFCFASTTIGTVDSTNKYAWGENVGWINFAPTNGVNYAGITITSTAITGYAWSSQYGWINFNPVNSGQGVLNSCSGSLSGYAWISGLGWLDMFGVTINSVGKFTGTAGTASTTVGRVSFDCSNCNVTTDWRPNCSIIQTENKAIVTLYPGTSTLPQTQNQLPPTSPVQPNITPNQLEPGINENGPGFGGGTQNVGNVPQEKPKYQQGQNPDTENIEIKTETPLQEGQDIFNKTKQVSHNPFVKVMVLIGLIIGFISGISNYLAGPIYLDDLRLLALKAWNFFPVILGLKKKPKNPWGTVYDSVTKQPLDPAYILLQDINGKEVKDAITDLDGRYGFLAEAGMYKLVGNKSNYTFPSQKLSGRINDELYDNLYFGEAMHFEPEQEVIARNIPMDSIGFDWNEFAKKNKRLMKFHSNTDKIFSSAVAVLIFSSGFLFSVVTALINPYAYNITTFVLYTFILIANVVGLRPRFTGRITNSQTGEPFSFAILKVYLVDSEKELFRKVCDRIGRYYCLVPPGKYIVKVDKKNIDGTYSFSYKSIEINAKKGIIKNHFKV